ncbi:TetR/AcrR family transcriptional regulator [Blastococcus sp. VKM Ac-2987]|uniref:TetR/AcrR family transcriptional regulator n=1 Tax=Blastococcus sp. VKM Ac-2987 TaxID=3004141 RepID=UPI0022AB75DB|nr:TetR/AcrR family transcriptional regulator [Blastococcus sp. VKM Ac-2987]MCZ2858515.1 helix-turn-helix domain containing protein [Blastococcus sp. VKM Ac-2987]
MGELTDRRARKKAQTREHVRTVARQLFDEHGFDAVTIADIARQADVAVQTVFNHFPTKEDLFFDGRTPWVSGPADAVRHRQPADCPLSALTDYLSQFVRNRIRALREADLRAYVRTLDASPSLRVHERELVFESERLLADSLREAWTDADRSDPGPTPHDPSTAAAITAAMWLSAVRALMVRHRPLVTAGADAAQIAADLGTFADRLLRGLADSAEQLRTGTAPPPGVEPVGSLRAG